MNRWRDTPSAPACAMCEDDDTVRRSDELYEVGHSVLCARHAEERIDRLAFDADDPHAESRRLRREAGLPAVRVGCFVDGGRVVSTDGGRVYVSDEAPAVYGFGSRRMLRVRVVSVEDEHECPACGRLVAWAGDHDWPCPRGEAP